MAEENENIDIEEDVEEDAEETTARGERELDFILDIPLELSVELGKTKMIVNDLLQLGQGSIIELNKLAGEPLEVYINRKIYLETLLTRQLTIIMDATKIRLTGLMEE